MPRAPLALVSLLVFCGCDASPPAKEAPRQPRQAQRLADDATQFEDRPRNASGRVYLPIYSHIYTRTGNTDDLAATISIRNVSMDHAIELEHVSYYDTKGHLIEDLLGGPVLLEPLETLEYFLPSVDKRGGSGANAVVQWHATTVVARPLVEAVMIRTSGSQAYAFTTRGVDVHNDDPETAPESPPESPPESNDGLGTTTDGQAP